MALIRKVDQWEGGGEATLPALTLLKAKVILGALCCTSVPCNTVFGILVVAPWPRKMTRLMRLPTTAFCFHSSFSCAKTNHA